MFHSSDNIAHQIKQTKTEKGDHNSAVGCMSTETEYAKRQRVVAQDYIENIFVVNYLEGSRSIECKMISLKKYYYCQKLSPAAAARNYNQRHLQL